MNETSTATTLPLAPGSDRAYLRGCSCALLAGFALSFGGVLVRWIEAASEWQFVFYRSLSLCAVLLTVLAARHRGDLWAVFRRAGWVGVVAGTCLAGGFIGFIFSLAHATVANTMFLLGTSPFFGALLGRTVLGERVAPPTWAAMAAAAVGVAIMVGSGLGSGSLFGNLTGLAAALCFAGFAVALRWGKHTRMTPAVCVAGLIAAAVSAAAVLSAGQSLVVSAHDFGLAVVHGAVILGTGLTLITLGSRHVPAAQLTLFSLLEIVLGPVWAWLGVGEVPDAPTLLGGAVVLSAIAWLASLDMRRSAPRGPISERQSEIQANSGTEGAETTQREDFPVV